MKLLQARRKCRDKIMTKRNVVTIKSLSDYIKQIDNLEPKVFFRGESKEYNSQIASAFRPYWGTFRSNKPFPFIDMVDEFYREVAYKLEDDKEDFIAFAQHYGIPTNLLDITSSPLAALYFACEKDYDEDGYIHLLDDVYIDVTDLIHRFPNKNLIDVVFANTPKELCYLVPIFKEFKKKHLGEFRWLLSDLIDEYLFNFRESFSNNEIELQKKLKDRDDYSEIVICLAECDNDLKHSALLECDIDICLYLWLQYRFFKKAKEQLETIFHVCFLPTMLYKPVITFERGRNQQGLFIYQGYTMYVESTYDFNVLLVQDICFTKPQFKIKNKREILKSLDKLGINKKTLFCDYDSIASYIKDKYTVEVQ